MNFIARFPRARNDRGMAVRAITAILALALYAAAGANVRAAEVAWIWHPETRDKQRVWFRYAFEVGGEVKKAAITGVCDNEFTAFLNGRQAIAGDNWQAPLAGDVTSGIQKGANLLAVEARNSGGPAGLLVRLTLEMADGSKKVIATGPGWKSSPLTIGDWRTADYNDGQWAEAKILGAIGGGGLPWNDSVTVALLDEALPATGDPEPKAQPEERLNLLPGFKAELIYTVPRSVQGSWVGMAKDSRGRLLVSDQGGAGMYRVTPARLGDPESRTRVEPLDVKLSGVQGMYEAFGAIYAHVNGGPGSGLYRLTDSDGDDKPDKVEKLMDIEGGGEHGPHAVSLTPDGKALYVQAGNHTKLPELTGGDVLTDIEEDLLLPRQWDARGHAKGVMAPGGWICRVDPSGKNWRLWSAGYRNPYDHATNRFGDIFAYDSDMEWDMGMPWYRPTRLVHATSGSEFGWRSGSGKFPVYFEDTLPATSDVGPGSPTGVTFGYGAKFPTKYQDAIYLLDWTFGTIHVVHLKENGASYTGESEEFVSGTPLPVTDAVIGDDGAFYFAIGGRGTQSALYRITYAGSESTAPPSGSDPAAAEARATRRMLENFHAGPDPKALDAAWPYLDHSDRFIRYAARVAVEHQPVKDWRARALNEKRPLAAACAMIALARTGEAADSAGAADALLEFDFAKLAEPDQLAMLRAYGLLASRLGRPDDSRARRIIAQLDPSFPSDRDDVNTELARVLVYLDAPGVVEKSLALMEKAGPPEIPDWGELLTRNPNYGGTIQKMLENHPPSRKIEFAFFLRNVRYGWTMEQRERYFTFINEAAKHPGGASYTGFLENIRTEALANCSQAERVELAALTGESLEPLPAFTVTPPKGPGVEWTVESALSAADAGMAKGRNYEQGRNLFHAVGCVKCHRFDGFGGAIGPDLSSVLSKFTRRDLLEAMIEPSKVISDQYGSFVVTTASGESATGLVVKTTDKNGRTIVEVHTSDINADPVRFAESDVKSIKQSPVSQMPEELLFGLNKTEMLDLVAYLLSRGNPEDPMFAK